MKQSATILHTDLSLQLADVLKEETWPLHKMAETTGVIESMLRQRITLKQYLFFLKNMKQVYETLKSSQSWLNNFEELSRFVNSSLYCSASLQNDLYKLESLQNLTPILEETHHYCRHIINAQNDSPAAMLGHIYVRYLCDLNGGPMLTPVPVPVFNL